MSRKVILMKSELLLNSVSVHSSCYLGATLVALERSVLLDMLHAHRLQKDTPLQGDRSGTRTGPIKNYTLIDSELIPNSNF